MAENEDKSEALKVESSLEQIHEDIERIHISFGSETSIAPKVESSTKQITKDLLGPHVSSGDKVVIYGNPRMALSLVSSEYLRGEEASGSRCKEGQEGDKFTRTFNQQWIDVGPHSFKGRCFKSVSIIT